MSAVHEHVLAHPYYSKSLFLLIVAESLKIFRRGWQRKDFWLCAMEEICG